MSTKAQKKAKVIFPDNIEGIPALAVPPKHAQEIVQTGERHMILRPGKLVGTTDGLKSNWDYKGWLWIFAGWRSTLYEEELHNCFNPAFLRGKIVGLTFVVNVLHMTAKTWLEYKHFHKAVGMSMLADPKVKHDQKEKIEFPPPNFFGLLLDPERTVSFEEPVPCPGQPGFFWPEGNARHKLLLALLKVIERAAYRKQTGTIREN